MNSGNNTPVDESPLQAAIAAHKGGRLLEAEAGYQRVLRGNPSDGDALNFLGMLTCQSGDVPAAVSYLRKSVEAVPGNAHAWVNLGNVLMVSGETDEARAALTKATELAPEMPLAWFNLGVCLGHCRLPHEAAAALHKALKLEPGYIPAYESLAVLFFRLRNYARAAEVYREWLQHDPGNPTALHMLAAASGEWTPTRADDRHIKKIFDSFSVRFDEILSGLGYRAPQLVTNALATVVGRNANLVILDAGCGTGLCAPLVGSMAGRLVGVDLSQGMIEKARQRGLYDELAIEELCQFMRSRPESFDVVLSADCLVYFGSLEEPLSAARACLRRGGVMIFTLERLDPAISTEPYRLEPHGRYTHAEAYVRTSAERAGFREITFETNVLRQERGEDVNGHVVVAWRDLRISPPGNH